MCALWFVLCACNVCFVICALCNVMCALWFVLCACDVCFVICALCNVRCAATAWRGTEWRSATYSCWTLANILPIPIHYNHYWRPKIQIPHLQYHLRLSLDWWMEFEVGWECVVPPAQLLHIHPLAFQLYLSKFLDVFVLILKCICLNLEMYLS